MKLPYVSWVNYLTEVGDLKWRRVDFDARVIVKAIKQEPFNGFLELKIGGQNRRFDQANIQEFVPALHRMMGAQLKADVQAPIAIVPIPNSGMAQGYTGPFRTVELAGWVAEGFGEGATVCPAVYWDTPRTKAHQSNEYRHPDMYEPHMVMGDRPQAQVVLFDDVLTSGSQMIAAARMLTKNGHAPVRGLVVATATKDQIEGGLFTKRVRELELSSDPFDFDEF